MGACMISALLTGVGGAIYPMRAAFATPDLMLWTESGEFIISVMIGGLGTLVGPIIGGAFFTILRDKGSSGVDWYFIVIGGGVVVLLVFFPPGPPRRPPPLRRRPGGPAAGSPRAPGAPSPSAPLAPP